MSVGILGIKSAWLKFLIQKGCNSCNNNKGGPCYVTQIKSTEKCGYNAVQIGYTEIAGNSRSLTKPRLGHFSKVNLQPFKYLKEYKTDRKQTMKLAKSLT